MLLTDHMINHLNKKPRQARFFSFLAERFLLAFYHCPQAACANSLTNLFTFFKDGNFLKIRFEHTICSTHGETSIVTKSGLFSTNFALRHDTILS